MTDSFLNFARTLAEKLDKGLVVYPYTDPDGNPVPGRVRLINALDEIELFLLAEDGGNRLLVKGVFPTHPDVYQSGREGHRITVNWYRGPQAVAGDIERRLLRGYLPELEAVKARITRAQEDVRSRERRLLEIERILAPDVRLDHRSLHWSAGPAYGEFTTNSDGSELHIELHNLPAEVGLEIARLIDKGGQR